MENLQHWPKTPEQCHSHFFDFVEVIFIPHTEISLTCYWRSKSVISELFPTPQNF